MHCNFLIHSIVGGHLGGAEVLVVVYNAAVHILIRVPSSYIWEFFSKYEIWLSSAVFDNSQLLAKVVDPHSYTQQ